jgi:hypothetical protein
MRILSWGLTRGHNWDKATTGTWLHALKHAHFPLLDEELFKLAGWGYKYSPSFLRKEQRKGSKLGHVQRHAPF